MAMTKRDATLKITDLHLNNMGYHEELNLHDYQEMEACLIIAKHKNKIDKDIFDMVDVIANDDRSLEHHQDDDMKARKRLLKKIENMKKRYKL